MGRKNTNPNRQRLKCRQCGELCHIGKTICHECHKLRKAQQAQPPPRINSVPAMNWIEYEAMQEPHLYREGRIVREDSLW